MARGGRDQYDGRCLACLGAELQDGGHEEFDPAEAIPEGPGGSGRLGTDFAGAQLRKRICKSRTLRGFS